MIELPTDLRQRLIRALETGQLGPPYSEIAVRNALGGAAEAPAVRDELVRLHARGIDGRALAYALEAVARAAAAVPRPDLVWSGPEVEGLHARDTRPVFAELVDGASRSLWISSYIYYDGPKAFARVAARMDAVPELQTTLLLNIKREWGDTSPADNLVHAFAEKLWTAGWPGSRRPAVFYDPRSLREDSDRAVLHAKAAVADDEVVFITSANLTEKAFGENIEVGMITRDRTLATNLSKHFRVLIERELLLPLPEV